MLVYAADRELFYFSCRKRFRLTVSHTTAADEANINTIGMITLVLSPVCTALSDEAVTVSGCPAPMYLRAQRSLSVQKDLRDRKDPPVQNCLRFQISWVIRLPHTWRRLQC